MGNWQKNRKGFQPVTAGKDNIPTPLTPHSSPTAPTPQKSNTVDTAYTRYRAHTTTNPSCDECGTAITPTEAHHTSTYYNQPLCNNCVADVTDPESTDPATELAAIPTTIIKASTITTPIYHGTRATLKPGDIITPAATRDQKTNWTHASNPSYAHATDDLQTAQYFASTSGHIHTNTPTHIYELEPVTPDDTWNVRNINTDPAITTNEYRSETGFRVTREHPPT